MAWVSIDVDDVGVAGGLVFAGSEYAEHSSLIVSYDVERAPLTMTFLARCREERHLVF